MIITATLSEMEKTESFTMEREINFFPSLSMANRRAMKYSVFKNLQIVTCIKIRIIPEPVSEMFQDMFVVGLPVLYYCLPLAVGF